jgi:hypothetical protein
MEPSNELIHQLQREEIEDARRMTISQKLEASGDLFDYACSITLAGIKSQHPGISTEHAMAKLRARLDFAARTESRA